MLALIGVIAISYHGLRLWAGLLARGATEDEG